MGAAIEPGWRREFRQGGAAWLRCAVRRGRRLKRAVRAEAPPARIVALASLPALWLAAVPAVLMAALLHGPPALAQEILIVRPLGNTEPEVTAAEIDFEVLVSAFDLVVRVSINGEAQTIEPGTMVRVKTRLALQPGPNAVVVVAATDELEERGEFQIMRLAPGMGARQEAREARHKRIAFQVFGATGVTHESNPLKVPEQFERESGLLTFLVVVPRLDYFPESGTGTFRVQSVLSREKYDQPEFADEEIALSQLMASWISTSSAGNEWSIGLGYNLIQQRWRSLLSGEEEAERDVFAFWLLKMRLGARDSYFSTGLEIKSRDVIAEPVHPGTGRPDPERDEDAQVSTITAEWAQFLGVFKNTVKGALALNDAKGVYKDRTIVRLVEELVYSALPYRFGVGLRLRRNMFAEADPFFDNVKPVETQLVTFGNAAWALIPAWMLSGEVRMESQRSNISGSEYQNRAVTMGVVFVY